MVPNSNLHYQQQHLLQQSSNSQLSHHQNGQYPQGHPAYSGMSKDQQMNIVQQLNRNKQSQGPTGVHASSS